MAVSKSSKCLEKRGLKRSFSVGSGARRIGLEALCTQQVHGSCGRKTVLMRVLEGKKGTLGAPTTGYS